MGVYKSQELCDEEQAIVEDALNHLAYDPEPTEAERRERNKQSNLKLQKLVDKVNRKRKKR